MRPWCDLIIREIAQRTHSAHVMERGSGKWFKHMLSEDKAGPFIFLLGVPIPATGWVIVYQWFSNPYHYARPLLRTPVQISNCPQALENLFAPQIQQIPNGTLYLPPNSPFFLWMAQPSGHIRKLWNSLEGLSSLHQQSHLISLQVLQI